MTRRLIGVILIPLLAAATVLNTSIAADSVNLESDGWYTWLTAAAPRYRQRCCYIWGHASLSPRRCDLDANRGNVGFIDGYPGYSPEIRLYVLMRDGDVQRLVALGPQCEVSTSTPIRDLGPVSATETATWLRRQVSSRSRRSSDAMAALSLLDAQHSFATLTSIIESDSDHDIRSEALFWLVQSDSDEAFAYLDRLLISD